MTVSISSSYPIQLVAGKGVQFSAAPVPSITTDNVYPGYAPTRSVTSLLNTLPQSAVRMVGMTSIDATAPGNSILYTVPAAQTFIPTQITFLLTAIAGSGTGPSISVGLLNPFQQLINSARTPGMFAGIIEAGDMVSVEDFSATAGHSGADFKYINGGAVLTAQVDAVATYSTYMLTCFVFGFLTGGMPTAALPASFFGEGYYGLDPYGA